MNSARAPEGNGSPTTPPLLVHSRSRLVATVGVKELVIVDPPLISKVARHRLENPGEAPLDLVEVQTGDYLGEDDIVRFDDAYRQADA